MEAVRMPYEMEAHDERMASGGQAAPSYRIFAVSDLHTDMGPNMEWVKALSRTAYRADVLLVAGDITDKLDILEETFTCLVERFGWVFFVPGNHDLWCKGPRSGAAGADANANSNSLHKLECVRALCRRVGVHVAPTRIPPPPGGKRGCWVVPLLSWYHGSFDHEPDIDYLELPQPKHVVRDFTSCVWPQEMDPEHDDEALASHFDRMNDYTDARTAVGELAGDELYEYIQRSGDAVVSFSHFLPRLELLPEKRYLFFPNLAKVVGSTMLGDRVAQLRPDVHIFGHTHFGWDQTVDGVRYVQAALAYPRERKARGKSLAVGNAPMELLQLYDAATDAFTPQQSAQWSDWYQTHAREPTNMELASYVQPQYAAQVAQWKAKQSVQALMNAAADELHAGHRIITSTETKCVMDSVLAMTHTSGP